MEYRDALQWLYGTQLYGIKLGLENIRRLLAEMAVSEGGNGARILHVAGTNGKGSVCAMIDSICRAQGLRSGLFTSPHLVTFRERIQINGTQISEAAIADGLTRIRSLTANWQHPPTFFEITTALALDYFRRENVDVIVLETGMGGRLDATNATTPAASVIASIGLDHTAYLGDSLTAIAHEKAGIIKRGVPVISAPQADEAAAVLREVAAQQNAPITFVQKSVDFPVALAGSHQRLNAAIAIETLRAAKIAVSDAAIREGLQRVIWQGRFQRIDLPNGARIILDGAHNPAAAARLVETWREEFPRERATLILGVLRDKEISGICRSLTTIARHVVLTPINNSRSSSVEELAAIFEKIAPEISVEIARDFPDALRRAQNHSNKILVAGSLFLVGEALAHLDPVGSGEQEKSAQ